MINRKVTRKEFLRMVGFGAFSVFILPGVKKLNFFKKEPYKEAKYYKTLAG